MRNSLFVRWLHPMLVACLLGGAPLQASDPADRPLAPVDRLEVPIPISLRGLMLEQPTVTFWVGVDETGRLVDFLPIGASYHRLLEAAEQGLRRATFAPALRAGQPVLAQGAVTVQLFDPNQRAYFQGLIPLPTPGNAGDLVERKLYEAHKEAYEYRPAKPSELARPLEVVEAKVTLVTDQAGRPAQGRCLVEYWVDPQGVPKFPRLLQSDNDTVALSALQTLRATRFAPPTRAGGVPACVQVRQPMEFDTAAAKAADAGEPKSENK
jgi:TonB family protein